MMFLYPSDPLDPKRPDEVFAEEYLAAREAGLSTTLFSFEEFQVGNFKPRAAMQTGVRFAYRGWMMAPEEYATLVDAIAAKGASVLTSAEQYRRCHHLPGWYELLAAETKCFPLGVDYVAGAENLGWPSYFVKDFVKSNSSAKGSLASSPAEIAGIVAEIEKYRGKIEGGVCVRRGERYLPDSEARYFVAAGKPFARSGEIPAQVDRAAKKIDSPFFTVDLALRDDGELRIIELGDGQVSDRKAWTVEEFLPVMEALSASS